MTTLAHAYRPRELATEAFALYEAFRPSVPEGVKGWGAKGVPDLRRIRLLAKVVAIDGMDEEGIRAAFPREKPGKPVA